MKNVKYLLLVFIAFTSLQGYCQKTIPVTLKNLYCGDGVIFTTEYKLPIIIEGGSKRFTPSIEDITKAETLLLSNPDEVKYKGLVGMYEPNKLKKKLCTYNRQYVGYQNAALDSIILIHLLNFKNKKQAKTNFTDWNNSYIIGFGDFYERNMLTVMLNLTKKEVSTF
jgi:hypothetical protein